MHGGKTDMHNIAIISWNGYYQYFSNNDVLNVTIGELPPRSAAPLGFIELYSEFWIII